MFEDVQPSTPKDVLGGGVRSLFSTNWLSQLFRIGIHQITCTTQGSSKSLCRIDVLGVPEPGFWHPVILDQLGYYCIIYCTLDFSVMS